MFSAISENVNVVVKHIFNFFLLLLLIRLGVWIIIEFFCYDIYILMIFYFLYLIYEIEQ